MTPMLLDTIVKYLNNNVARFVERLLQNSLIQVTYHSDRLAYRLEKEARKSIPPSTKDRTEASASACFTLEKTLSFIFCARLKIIRNPIFNFHDFIAFK